MRANRFLKVLVLTAASILVFGVAYGSATPPDFVVPMQGRQEVPPVDTPASGIAHFMISDDGASIDYRLTVQDITNVVASHIHIGAPGVNGPVVVFLFGPAAPGGGPVSGVIAEGTFTEANLIGPLAGQSLSVLIEAMRTGGTYVNVHTNDGVPPTNTGPGDFPGGEIRGLIGRARAHKPSKLQKEMPTMDPDMGH